MAYLLDTNCWMQIIRQREHSASVDLLLRLVPRSEIFITDFGLHTLLILLDRHKQLKDFETFTKAVGLDDESIVVEVPPARLSQDADIVSRLKLDVDDGYHYVAAEIHGLTLVSFDADFDRTPGGRMTPAQALQHFKDEQQKQSKDA